MNRTSPLPTTGEVFLDPRGGDRVLRVSWHPDDGVAVLSIWRHGVCAGTFRLPTEQIPDLVEALRGGLSTAYSEGREPLVPGMRSAVS